MQSSFKVFYKLIIFLLAFFSVSYQAVHAQSKLNAYSFSFLDIDGKKINLEDFKGKVVMIVNTASQCKFTPQYAQLEELYERFNKQGLVIIAVPSNDFGQQEPGSKQQIKNFIDKKYQVTFLVADKTHVTGKDAHPFYKWAETQVTYVGTPMWNFHKYIIDKNGDLQYWFTSTTEPTSNDLVRAIQTLLNSK